VAGLGPPHFYPDKRGRGDNSRDDLEPGPGASAMRRIRLAYGSDELLVA